MESRRPTVLVVGSTMMDLITRVDRVPEGGETVRGVAFDLGFGGKGANQAVVASLLGASVAFVNRVGDDQFGQQTVDHLRRLGIDVRHVAAVGDATGVATILVDGSGENRIVIAPGANEWLHPDDVDAAFDDIPSPDVVLCQLEIGQDAVVRAMQRGRACGATTILNPAPAAELDPRLPELLDWIVPNESELAVLSGGSATMHRPAEEAATQLRQRWGVGVVVTMGAEGALLVTPSDSQTPAKVTTDVVNAVDTTGAGDAFSGAFAAALAAQWSPSEAAALACRCATDSVTRPGTQSAYLSSDLLPMVRTAHRWGAAPVAEGTVVENERTSEW